MIELRVINEDNFEECIGLRLTKEQSEYITSNAYSLCEAYSVRDDEFSQPITYAIYNDETMIGFSMIMYQPYDPSDEDDDHKVDIYYMPRLMIDKRFQGNGFGKKALDMIIQRIKERPLGKAEEFCLHVSQENKVAYDLYLSRGFDDTGIKDEDGDNLLVLKI